MRQIGLAAELAVGLVERHVMAAFGGGDRRLHAGRAAADHHHPLALRRRRQRAVAQFAPGFGMLDAGNRQAAMEMADAGLVAGDAGADIVRAVVGGLGGHGRIADQRPGHAAHVGLSLGDDRFRLLRLIDAAGDEDRDFQALAETIGIAGKIAALIGHGRGDMHRAAKRRRGASGNVDVVQQVFQPSTAFQCLFLGQAFLIAFTGADAHADDEVLAGRGAHGGQRLAGEAQPVLHRAAIGILAAVDAGIEELRRQIAMAGNEFDAVEPGLEHAPGGRCIAVDDLLDHRKVEDARHDAEPLVGGDRGRIGDGQQPVAAFHDLAAGMEKLREDGAAMRMTGIRQLSIAFDAIVVGGHQHMRSIARRLMHAGDLGDDQADAAPGAGFVVGNQRLVDEAVGRQRRVVAGGEDTVLDFRAAKGDRREQMREKRLGHWPSPRFAAAIAFQSTGDRA